MNKEKHMMKMKITKIIILLIATVMMLGMVGAVSATPTLSVVVPTTEINVGETITVPVIMNESLPFTSFKIHISNEQDGAIITVSGSEVDGEFIMTKGIASGSYEFNSGESLSSQYVAYARTNEYSKENFTLFYLDIKITEKPVLLVPIVLTITEYYNVSKENQADLVTVQEAVVKVQRQADVASYPEAVDIPSTLSYGDTGTLSAVVYNQYNEVMNGAQVTWTSSNPECLSIDASTGTYQVIGCSVSPVTVSVSCGDGENLPTVTYEIHLVKSTPVLSDFVVSLDLSEDIVYDGTAKEVTLTPVSGKDGFGTVTVKYNGAYDVPVSVGSYIVTAELSEGTNYNASTFELGTLNITGKSIAEPVLGTNLTYTGALQTVPLEQSPFYDITGETTAVAAGVYTVSVVLNDSANMMWADGTNGEFTYVWEITPRDIAQTRLSLTGDFTYDGNGHAPTVCITDGGIELSTNDYIYGGDLQNVTAGFHVLSLFGQNNYTGEITAEWKIKQAVPSVENISCTIPSGIIYDGEEHAVTVSEANGVYGLGTISVYYNGDAKAPVAAGKYEVTASIAEGTNYTATTVPLSLGSFTILPAELSRENLTYSLDAVDYDGNEHPVIVTLKDGKTGDITVTYNGSTVAPVSAGIYQVNVSVANVANYNDTEFNLGTFTVNKAALSLDNFIITPILPASVDYDGSSKNVSVKAKDVLGIGEIIVTYNDVTTEPVALGSYLVNVTVAEGQNYTYAAFSLGTLTISGLTIIEPTISSDFVYDGTVKTPEIIESINSAGYYTVLDENKTATAAGTYTITLQLKDSVNTSWSKTTGDLKLTWTIAPKSILDAIITTSDKFVYDGDVKTPSFVLKDGDVTISSNDYEISGDISNSSAGIHYVAFQGKNNYTNVITSKWSIEKAVPTLDVIDYTIPTGIIYNGQPQGITAVLNTTYAGVGALTVSYSDSTEIPTNAGTYIVTASVVGGDNYTDETFDLGNYVILPAELTKDDLIYELTEVTYDGKEHPVTVTLEDGKTGDITVTYNDSTEVPIAAGTYQVNVTVKNVANYNDTEFNLGTFAINKAALSVENFAVKPSLTESIIFDGKEHLVTVTPQGIVGCGDISVTYNDGTAIPVAIGTYKVNITVINGQNYADAELNLGTLTITGLKIAEPTLTETQFTYDGSAKTPEIVDSTNSKDRYTVVQENLTATAAGTYTITLQLKDAANTSWSGAFGAGDLKLTWTINPTSIAGVSVSTTEETIIYDGSEKKPNFVVKSGETVLSKNDYEISGIISSFAAGNHTVTVTGKNNYTGTATGTWEIAKAAPTDDVVDFTIPSGVVYNGHPQGITAALNASYAGVGELSLKYYNGTTEEQPVNAGIYLVNATVAEGQNYTAAEFTLGNFEILRANPSVDNLTFTLPENAVYNGKMFEADCVAKEGVELGAITVVYNATPIAAGTYKVNASIAESLNFNATELTIGEFTIAKATLTSDNLTVTPELPVSYDNESGSAKPVVVTVKPGIFGNGTIKVEYGESTALPTLAGVYKVNANITAGTNYTAGTIYLGNMTVVEKVAPKFESVVITTTETNTTVTGADTVDSTNTTQISDGSGVVLKITFSDYEQESNTVSGNISAVIVQYPEKPAASPQKKAEGTTYNLTIDLGNKLTTALPEITPVYNDDVEKKVSNKLESTNTNSKKITFTGLAMMTATGDNVDDINKNITKKDGVKLTFKIPQFDLSDKEKIVVYHVSGNSVVKVYEGKPTADNGHYLITVTGSGFSSYVAGVEETTVTQSTGGSTPPVNSGGTGSGKKPTTVPTTPPTEEPTEDPTDKPDTPDVPGIDTPTEPETPATPAPVAGMILGALAVAAVLRRK